MSPTWSPSRAAALARLRGFVPQAVAYAAERNFDRPGHPAVSRLSPWLRARLLTEGEVLAAVRAAHRPSAVEKFADEVLWRTYYKGYLEQRPALWRRYRAAAQGLRHGLRGGALAAWEAAVEGRTGIDAFDAWARELAATGYLHNHARMWFASIWTFTLRLPWELGAAFFLRHLLDGDPASNTLSWRWVAGLHTVGKHYVARAANIEHYTGGRFHPYGQLDEHAAPLPPDEPAPRVPLAPRAFPVGLNGPFGLLLHGDDLHPESLPLPPGAEPAAVAAGWDDAVGAALDLATGPAAFGAGALADGLARAAAHFRAPATTLDPARWAESATEWAAAEGLRAVLTPEAPVGPWAERLAALEGLLAARGVPLVRLRRRWDDALWPHATRGFFSFRQAVGPLLDELLPGGQGVLPLG